MRPPAAAARLHLWKWASELLQGFKMSSVSPQEKTNKSLYYRWVQYPKVDGALRERMFICREIISSSVNEESQKKP